MTSQAKRKLNRAERLFILSPSFYASREWLHLRNEAVRMAGNKCEASGCNQREHLHVHHLRTRWKCPERALDPSNLIVYCPMHHSEHHEWLSGRHRWSNIEPANDAQFELRLEFTE